MIEIRFRWFLILLEYFKGELQIEPLVRENVSKNSPKMEFWLTSKTEHTDLWNKSCAGIFGKVKNTEQCQLNMV